MQTQTMALCTPCMTHEFVCKQSLTVSTLSIILVGVKSWIQVFFCGSSLYIFSTFNLIFWYMISDDWFASWYFCSWSLLQMVDCNFFTSALWRLSFMALLFWGVFFTALTMFLSLIAVFSLGIGLSDVMLLVHKSEFGVKCICVKKKYIWFVKYRWREAWCPSKRTRGTRMGHSRLDAYSSQGTIAPVYQKQEENMQIQGGRGNKTPTP